MNDEITVKHWIDEFVSNYSPCEDSVSWLRENQFPDPQTAWDACQRGDWMAWLIDREMAFSDEPHLRTEEKRFAVKIKLARHFAEDTLTPRGLEFLGLLEELGPIAATADWKKKLREFDYLAYEMDYGSLATVVSMISMSLYESKPPLEFFETVAHVIRQVYPEVPRPYGYCGK